MSEVIELDEQTLARAIVVGNGMKSLAFAALCALAITGVQQSQPCDCAAMAVVTQESIPPLRRTTALLALGDSRTREKL